jgi:hypothetical protein
MALPVSTAIGHGNASVAVSQPSGHWASGNLLIAVVAGSTSATASITAPSGWTLVANSPAASLVQISVYSYPITGTPPTSFTWSASEAYMSACIAEYTGFSGVDTSAVNHGSSTSPSWTAITTSAANEAVILALGNYTNSTLTWPSGYTQEVTTSNSTHCYTYLADATQSSAGSTGALTGTFASSESWATVTLALTPSGGGGTNYPASVTESVSASDITDAVQISSARGTGTISAFSASGTISQSQQASGTATLGALVASGSAALTNPATATATLPSFGALGAASFVSVPRAQLTFPLSQRSAAQHRAKRLVAQLR